VDHHQRRSVPLSWHARAPARIDFGGGWTDVPDYSDREGGVVVNAAINCYVRVDVLGGGNGIRLIAEDLGIHVRYATSGDMRYDGKLDLHKAALNMLPVTGGVEVLSRSDLPAGSGLGGSGALDVALVAALARARGEWYDRPELAELGFHLEAIELKLRGGRQDQYAAALGGFNELIFTEDSVLIKPIDMPGEQAADLVRHLVLIYTGESHFSSDTHHRVWSGYAEGRPQVIDALHTLKDLGNALPAPIRSGDWSELARLMDENWTQQQRLDPTISTPGTKTIEQAARATGAWGLKGAGAGAGGCMVIVCEPSRREAIVRSVEQVGASVLQSEFDFEGVTTWEEAVAGDDEK
jgi:D-glycero-alpha-D-manno-heptose-7-phosphate kinase